MSPALAGRFSTTVPPGKSLFLFLIDLTDNSLLKIIAVMFSVIIAYRKEK